MGKNKIKIEYVDNLKARRVHFAKRKKGLFDKVSDFVRDFDVDIGLVLISQTGRVYTRGSAADEVACRLWFLKGGADHDGASTSTAAVRDDHSVPVSGHLDAKVGVLNVDVGKLSSEAELDTYMQDLGRLRSRLLRRVTDIKASSSWPTITGDSTLPPRYTITEDSAYPGTSNYTEDITCRPGTYTEESPLPGTTVDHTTTEGSLFSTNNDTELDSEFRLVLDFDQASPQLDTFLPPITFPTEPLVQDQMLQYEKYCPTQDVFSRAQLVPYQMLQCGNSFPALDQFSQTKLVHDQTFSSENYCHTLDEFAQEQLAHDQMLPSDNYLPSLGQYCLPQLVHDQMLSSDNYLPTLDQYCQAQLVHDHMLPSENYFPILDQFAQSESFRQMLMNSIPYSCMDSVMYNDNTAGQFQSQ